MAGIGGPGDDGGHGHGHGHHHPPGGSCSCEHNHDDDVAERGTLYSLYMNIDTERVRCLNEAHDGSAKTVFKPWHERMERDRLLITLIIQSMANLFKGHVCACPTVLGLS